MMLHRYLLQSHRWRFRCEDPRFCFRVRKKMVNLIVLFCAISWGPSHTLPSSFASTVPLPRPVHTGIQSRERKRLQVSASPEFICSLLKQPLAASLQFLCLLDKRGNSLGTLLKKKTPLPQRWIIVDLVVKTKMVPYKHLGYYRAHFKMRVGTSCYKRIAPCYWYSVWWCWTLQKRDFGEFCNVGKFACH